MYVRRHKPKFWETFQRVFPRAIGGHNALQLMVMDRIKNTLKYPEAARHMIRDQSVLFKVEEYGMGKKRKVRAGESGQCRCFISSYMLHSSQLEDYLESVAGVDMTTKQVRNHDWCHKGVPPDLRIYDHLRPLYE